MPTTYTHYKFGVDVIDSLPARLQQAIENNRELFDIGLHGPDILFYHGVVKTNRVSQAGVTLHEQPATAFFEYAVSVMKDTIDQAAARVYLYGVICHFALDSECHKYVEKMIQVSGISHHEIEMEFDRFLLVGEGVSPTIHVLTNHLIASMKNAQVIASFYQGIGAKAVHRALKRMLFIHSVLLASNPVKRKFLAKVMKLVNIYDEKYGLIMSVEANAKCQDYVLLLKKLYAGAVPLAVGLIMQYQKVLQGEGKMPIRFSETFGAGEDWEKIIL